MRMNIPIVTLSAVNLRRAYQSHAVVQQVSIELKQGEVLGLLGPNGAGKTTTLRMLAGNLAPDDGNIEICGIDLFEQPKEAKAHLGYLPEIPPLYPEMTVDEYLIFAARLHRVDHTSIHAQVDDTKRRCGLSHRGRQLIATLSKGFQQRLGIAQAIIHSPAVIILDEPTVGLDPNQMREIRELIMELKAFSSVILSTHILSEVDSICDRVQILHQGSVVLDQTLADLKQQQFDLEAMFSRLTQ